MHAALTEPATLTYCIDGTNLVRRAYGYGGPEHRAQEEADAQALLAGLARLCEDSPSIEIDVVFDGPVRPAAAGPNNLRVRCAYERQADELILDRVRALRRAGQKVAVVTGDARLGEEAQEEGGRWIRAREGAGLSAIVGAIARR